MGPCACDVSLPGSACVRGSAARAGATRCNDAAPYTCAVCRPAAPLIRVRGCPRVRARGANEQSGLLLGVFDGFADYLRFAAAEVVAEAAQGYGISLALSGGALCSVAGPQVAALAQANVSRPPARVLSARAH